MWFCEVAKASHPFLQLRYRLVGFFSALSYTLCGYSFVLPLCQNSCCYSLVHRRDNLVSCALNRIQKTINRAIKPSMLQLGVKGYMNMKIILNARDWVLRYLKVKRKTKLKNTTKTRQVYL